MKKIVQFYMLLLLLASGIFLNSCGLKKEIKSFACVGRNYDSLNKAIENYISLFNDRKFDSVVSYFPPFELNYIYRNYVYSENPNAPAYETTKNRLIHGYKMNDSLNRKTYLPYNKFEHDTGYLNESTFLKYPPSAKDTCFCSGDTIIAWATVHSYEKCPEKFDSTYCINGKKRNLEVLLCISFDNGSKWFVMDCDEDLSQGIEYLKNKDIYKEMKPAFSNELLMEVLDFPFFNGYGKQSKR